jgi:hypothetical protein
MKSLESTRSQDMIAVNLSDSRQLSLARGMGYCGEKETVTVEI